MDRRRLTVLLAGVGISGLCLWYAFKGVEFLSAINLMARVAPLYLLGSVLYGLTSLLARAVRWRMLLSGIKVVHHSSMASATFIGIAANNLLPMRLGELVRAWILARRETLPLLTVLASVGLERLMDFVSALALLAFALSMTPAVGENAAHLLYGTGITLFVLVGLAVCGLLVAIGFRRQIATRLAPWKDRTGQRSSLALSHSPDSFSMGCRQSEAEARSSGLSYGLLLCGPS